MPRDQRIISTIDCNEMNYQDFTFLIGELPLLMDALKRGFNCIGVRHNVFFYGGG